MTTTASKDQKQREAAWDQHYERVYPRIAGTLQHLVDRYGFDLVLGIFANDMPTHFPPREREPRHPARIAHGEAEQMKKETRALREDERAACKTRKRSSACWKRMPACSGSSWSRRNS
jgi:hypothetical protein